MIDALTLQRHLPHLSVRVVRSKDIGIIDAGEGITAVFPRHLFSSTSISSPNRFAKLPPPRGNSGSALRGVRDTISATPSPAISTPPGFAPNCWAACVRSPL
jgi:hypothetical protein